MARNPRTGAPVEVSARPVPVFKPSKDLRTLVEEKPLEVWKRLESATVLAYIVAVYLIVIGVLGLVGSGALR